MTLDRRNALSWDREQREVILGPPERWQLVEAGPGTGKSAVACQRIAHLIDEGLPAPRMLLVSFTRTAVAELRERILCATSAGDARNVRISTIDSHAWSLRSGFEDEGALRQLDDGSYDLSIGRTIDLFRRRQVDLCDFMSRLAQLVIDEAQDVVGVRADLVIEMLRSVSDDCGVTILADPAQAIYGFTTDESDGSDGQTSLLARLQAECPRPLMRKRLSRIHRIGNDELLPVFQRTRQVVDSFGDPASHVARVQQTIQDTCCDEAEVTNYSEIPDCLSRGWDDSDLVLFRRRADVLSTSSYCSQAGIEHRLRMSDVPIVVRPWLGWLLGPVTESIVTRAQFDRLWETRAAMEPRPLAGEERDQCWSVLHRLAAGRREGTIDLMQIRRIAARARPPLELCQPDLGSRGPVLSTIHASKGREADSVLLVMPAPGKRADGDRSSLDSAAIFEEGRVYYVGATRARMHLAAARCRSWHVGQLESKRVYRSLSRDRAQLEVGRAGDVDPVAHLAWRGADEVQRCLASCVRTTVPVYVQAAPDEGYARYVMLEQEGPAGVKRALAIGEMSAAFQSDVRRLWSRKDRSSRLKPSLKIPHLYLIGVKTVGVSEAQRSSVKPPFSQSGLALAPLVKGYPVIHFFGRKRRRRFR